MQLMSFHMAEVQRPHAVGFQLPVCRYIGTDHHAETWAHMQRMELVPALQKVMGTGWGGGAMDLVFSPDWAAYGAVTNSPPPSANMCCPECFAAKQDFRHPDYQRQPVRPYESYDTQCSPFLALFRSRNDLLYDPEHCNNQALANGVVHPIYLWVVKNLPVSYQQSLQEVYKKHFTRCPYYVPLTEGPGKRDWSPSNLMTKELMNSDEFWDDLAAALPCTTDGVQVTYKGEQLVDPLQEYLKLMRFLMKQLTACNPTRVTERDDLCHRAHTLFHIMGFSPRRFTGPLHYFFEHYQPRLMHHGSLLPLCSEGGEHLHQPHSTIVDRRPSRPRWKCPIGIVEIMKHCMLSISLWRQCWRVPSAYFTKCPTFPRSDYQTPSKPPPSPRGKCPKCLTQREAPCFAWAWRMFILVKKYKSGFSFVHSNFL